MLRVGLTAVLLLLTSMQTNRSADLFGHFFSPLVLISYWLDFAQQLA